MGGAHAQQRERHTDLVFLIHPPNHASRERKGPHEMATRPDTHARTVLPIPDRDYAGRIVYDAKSPDAKFPPIEPLRPPEGAPNVLIILIDDVGFGASSAFGGPCATPNFDAV